MKSFSSSSDVRPPRVLPARFLAVPVGGGPPARSPHASLRLGVVDLEARPGPAAAPRHPSWAARGWTVCMSGRRRGRAPGIMAESVVAS